MYGNYNEQYEEDTNKAIELCFKVEKCNHNISLLKKHNRTNKNKTTMDNRLIMLQKELFLTKRHLVRIYARTIGKYDLNDNIIAKRVRVLLAIQPSNIF